MTRALVRKANSDDIEAVIANIRDADREEIEKATGIQYDRVLRDLPNSCDEIWAGLADDDCGVIFGFQRPTFLSEETIVWLISTDVVEKKAKLFLKHCKEVFGLMCEGHSYLFNYVDADNKVAIRWLEWLGFTIHEAEPFGAYDKPFHRFDKRL